MKESVLAQCRFEEQYFCAKSNMKEDRDTTIQRQIHEQGTVCTSSYSQERKGFSRIITATLQDHHIYPITIQFSKVSYNIYSPNQIPKHHDQVQRTRSNINRIETTGVKINNKRRTRPSYKHHNITLESASYKETKIFSKRLASFPKLKTAICRSRFGSRSRFADNSTRKKMQSCRSKSRAFLREKRARKRETSKEEVG